MSARVGKGTHKLTLYSIPTRLMILNKACPSRTPWCALLSLVKPISALLSSHFVAADFLIQCAVTAKYPSVLLACHASHVKLTSPSTVGPCKCKLIMKMAREREPKGALTLNSALSCLRYSLNMYMTSLHVAFRPGTLTALLARHVMSINSLNLGCSSA